MAVLERDVFEACAILVHGQTFHAHILQFCSTFLVSDERLRQPSSLQKTEWMMRFTLPLLSRFVSP
jgi:hypothetical protein